MDQSLDYGGPRQSIAEKLVNLNWGLVLLLAAIGAVGIAMLYSAANGSWQPWAEKQALRLGVAALVMLAVALVDLRTWLRIAYGFYGVVLLLLIAVQLRGAIGMGAQRWIDLGVIQIQPSELMKIAAMMALARYFNGVPVEEIGRLSRLVVPALIVLVPVALVLKQPDLGTALMLVLGGGAMFFLAGVRLWMFGALIATALGAGPVVWRFMRDYQKNRIYTFLDPENDPARRAGYHSLQSKIAIGSGGMTGKGFLM